MPQPILCLDEEVYHFAKRFDALFSKPQFQYLVTVLQGLMECDGKRTLSGLLHEVSQPYSLSGLSRFFSQALWEPGAEELGLDHYQVMSASALLRFWTLAMLAYVFLEEEQQRLRLSWQRPVTIGEARREIQRRHRRCLLEWLHDQFLSGVHPETLFELFAA